MATETPNLRTLQNLIASSYPAAAHFAPEPPAKRTPRTSSEEPQSAARKMRLLVVDDEPDIAELLALMLSIAGHEVVTAMSGAEALEAAHSGTFDAVISDLGMPQMSGYDLAFELRRLPQYRDVPLIAVTGFTRAADRERARAYGFTAFLPKPIDPDQLVAIVENARS